MFTKTSVLDQHVLIVALIKHALYKHDISGYRIGVIDLFYL